jgi:hypothetical protein
LLLCAGEQKRQSQKDGKNLLRAGVGQDGEGPRTAVREAGDWERQPVIGTSLLWIGSQRTHGLEATFGSLRSAGLFPVGVDSVDGALGLLSQFQVGIVVLDVADGGAWNQCARLLAGGSRVAVLVDSIQPESIDRYLSVGCAAVIAASCTPDRLTAALRRVAAGHREVVCPEASRMNSGEISHPSPSGR